jgi:hypothetical protein
MGTDASGSTSKTLLSHPPGTPTSSSASTSVVTPHTDLELHPLPASNRGGLFVPVSCAKVPQPESICSTDLGALPFLVRQFVAWSGVVWPFSFWRGASLPQRLLAGIYHRHADVDGM